MPVARGCLWFEARRSGRASAARELLGVRLRGGGEPERASGFGHGGVAPVLRGAVLTFDGVAEQCVELDPLGGAVAELLGELGSGLGWERDRPLGADQRWIVGDFKRGEDTELAVVADPLLGEGLELADADRSVTGGAAWPPAGPGPPPESPVRRDPRSCRCGVARAAASRSASRNVELPDSPLHGPGPC